MSLSSMLLRIGLAILTSGVIGFEREYKNRPAGLRTHILVGLGACVVAMIEASDLLRISALGAAAADVSVGRMSAQVISGIGFLGAGTILVSRRNIMGLTTAASLWTVACLGLAIGAGYFGIGLIGTGCTLIVLVIIKRLIVVHEVRYLQIIFTQREATAAYLNRVLGEWKIRMEGVEYDMEREGDTQVFSATYHLAVPRRFDLAKVVCALSEGDTAANIRSIRSMEG